MKVLDMRHTSGEVVLMTWSPRMDLIAIVNSNCDVILYRLSWQKVWTLGNNLDRGLEVRKETPLFLTWHPEGISLIIGFSNSAFIIDTELGKVMHSHSIKDLCSCNWVLTQYQPSFKEIYEREKYDQFKSEIPTLKMETNLSLLLLGTKSHEIYIYTGSGVLFTMILKPSPEYEFNILKYEVSPDLSSIQLLKRLPVESAGGAGGEMLVLSCYKSELLPSLSEVLGASGIKLMYCKRAVRALEEEMLGINENWKKIYDIFIHYLTFGSTKENLGGSKLADYVDLLVTGAASSDIEFFLGAGGREKEAKRNLTTIQTAKVAIREHCTNVKKHATFLINELQEIGGIFQLISEKKVGEDAVLELQLNYGLIFLSCVYVQHLIDKLVNGFHHFITLIINTVQTFNHHETPTESIEEDPDPDKVLEFLKIEFFDDIFTMISLQETISPEDKPIYFKDLPNLINIELGRSGSSLSTNPKYIKWLSFSQYMKQNDPILQPTFDITDLELYEFLVDVTVRLDEKWTALYGIPLLDQPIDHEYFVLNCFPNRLADMADKTGVIYEPNSGLTYVYHKEENDSNTEKDDKKKLWIYQCDLNSEIPTVSTVLLQFNLNIKFTSFFSPSVLTVLFYDITTTASTSTDQNHGRVTLVQLGIQTCFEHSNSRDLRILKGTKTIDKWNDLNIKIPTEIFSPSLTPNPYIQSLLQINDLQPQQMAISGPRRVGCILSTNKKSVYLLDMENDSKDDSEADTTINSVTSDTE